MGEHTIEFAPFTKSTSSADLEKLTNIISLVQIKRLSLHCDKKMQILDL